MKYKCEHGRTVLVCEDCGNKHVVPPVITGSVCYGCRARDDYVRQLSETIKHLEACLQDAEEEINF